MHTFRHRRSHDDLFSGKWRPWDIVARDHGHGGGGGGRGGWGGGDGGGRGSGGNGGNHGRGGDDDNDDTGWSWGGGFGNGDGSGWGSGNGNGNGHGSGSGSSGDDDDGGGNSNNGNGGNSNTKTQKKTTTARPTTKAPTQPKSTPKAQPATTPTKEAPSPVKTKEADPTTSTPSAKPKALSTTAAAESPATREPDSSRETHAASSSSSNGEVTEVPVAVTAASSRGSGSPTQVVGAPGTTTDTPSSQSPTPGLGGHRNSTNVGGIVAGLVVGILALLVLIFLGWKYRRSKALAPLFSRFQTNRGAEDRQAMSSSPNMGESLITGAGAMAHGRGDGNRSPPAYEETKAALESASAPLAHPVAAVTRSRSHRAHQSTGSLQRKPVPAGYGEHPRPAPSMVENPNRVPISLVPGPMRIRRATSPSSSTRAPPHGRDRGVPGVSGTPVSKWSPSNLPVPPPEPYGRESSDNGDRRTTNHSGWSSLLPPNGDTTDPETRRRDSFVSIGGVSIASSGVISPSVLNWPMPPSTPPTMSVTGLSEDSRQSPQPSVRAPEQSKPMRQVYQSPIQPMATRNNRHGPATGQAGEGAEVLTASRITFQQPSRTVVRVQRRSTQSSTPSSDWSEPRHARER